MSDVDPKTVSVVEPKSVSAVEPKIMSDIELLDCIEVHNTLGECILWNERNQSAWWTDIHAARLYHYKLAQRHVESFPLPERLASFGFTENDGWLICAFASGFALYHPTTQQLDWIAKPEQNVIGTRFNDGRVDRFGRFWSGTMVESETATGMGNLYCLSGRQCQKVLTGIRISNSICWAPDNKTFYFADSPRYKILAHNFDAATGAVAQPRVFAEISAPIEPDGSTVDAEGYLWNAQWGGGKVVRYNPRGEVALEISLPVSQPTCVAFGGHDLNLLLVTTANVGLSTEQREQQPLAGNLFIYRTPFKGLPEARFSR